MIDMGMGQQQIVDILALSEREGPAVEVAHCLVALEQSALDQEGAPGVFNPVAGAGNRSRRVVKGDFRNHFPDRSVIGLCESSTRWHHPAGRCKQRRSTKMSKGAILVIGAGEGTGAEVGKRFAREGYTACVARRSGDKLAPLVAEIESDGGIAHGFSVDGADEKAVTDLVSRIEADFAPIDVAVYNSAAMLRAPAAEVSGDQFRDMWETICFGGFVMGREVGNRMTTRGAGTILFTGATASIKASANYIAFASAKFGLRAVAQAMAKDYGPKGVHVAHVVIDGIIDVPRSRERMPDYLAELTGRDAALSAQAIAETYWQLHVQPRTARTWEIDVRPWSETW